MRKLLIVGKNGMLGRECMNIFGDNAIGLGSAELDISNSDQCFNKLDDLVPPVIINCAAFTSSDACESDPTCWKINRDGPKYLAQWAEINKAFFVHISTDYVFSGDREKFFAHNEGDETKPISEYGKSKLAGELAVLDTNANAAILRTAWLYSEYGNNFLKTMLRLTIQNPGKEIKVVDDQYGTPTWAHVLARQIEIIVDKKVSGVFHASSEGYCSWYKLACTFMDLLGVENNFIPCETNEFPTPTKRPANSILENARLNELGINGFGNWEEELSAFVKQSGKKILAEINSL